MNWIGGARNRVRCQGDKRRQKEYFERKKFCTKVTNGFRSSPKKCKVGVSQDLKAIQTINRAHAESFPFLQKSTRPVKKVDMGVMKRPRFREVNDLGSPSPIITPSKLMLMEPKYQCDKPSSERKYYSSSSVLVPNRSKSDQNTFEESPLLPVEKQYSQESFEENKSQKYNHNLNEISKMKQHQNLTQCNSWISRCINQIDKKQYHVSEDFQTTPLMKYTFNDKHFLPKEKHIDRPEKRQIQEVKSQKRDNNKFEANCVEMPSTKSMNMKIPSVFEQEMPTDAFFKTPIKDQEFRKYRRPLGRELVYPVNERNLNNWGIDKNGNSEPQHLIQNSFNVYRHSFNTTDQTPVCTSVEGGHLKNVFQTEDFIQIPVKNSYSNYGGKDEKYESIEDADIYNTEPDNLFNDLKWSHDAQTPKAKMHYENKNVVGLLGDNCTKTEESIFSNSSSLLSTPLYDQRQLLDTESFYSENCKHCKLQNSDTVPDLTEDHFVDEMCRPSSQELYVPQALTPKSQMLYRKRTETKTPSNNRNLKELPKIIKLDTPQNYHRPHMLNFSGSNRSTAEGKEYVKNVELDKNHHLFEQYLYNSELSPIQTYRDDMQNNLSQRQNKHGKWQDGIDELLAEINELEEECECDKDFNHELETEREIQDEQDNNQNETRSEVANILNEALEKVASINDEQISPPETQNVLKEAIGPEETSNLMLSQSDQNNQVGDVPAKFAVVHEDATNHTNNSECFDYTDSVSNGIITAHQIFESVSNLHNDVASSSFKVTRETQTTTKTLIDSTVSPLVPDCVDIGIQCCIITEHNSCVDLDLVNTTSQESFYSVQSETEISTPCDDKDNHTGYSLRSRMK